ncbi:GDPGTP exchange factor Sec2p [Kalmanozyma brasiliensis GHG001]|uniref:GDP/GTP exchange factor Sec2 N-terminal domain-containing protein n=1 Tax=Kalmanozyma brasiliensis (strain GHG001) TaxID=1365824 RepID=V5GKJ9_KALBG|nr:GDPGTP exchange factor Sec2p [Kalmanozyma brasiliensis GHG001]EST06487.1 GDPGTP exchange factor Sec2p [Kalmanozyma brasiliensis GHG001]
MSAASGAEPERQDDSKTEASDDGAIPESQLQRTDPDSILADEADPDKVLGEESSSDAAAKSTASSGDAKEGEESAALKRASAASAIFSQSESRPQSQLPPSAESNTDSAPATTDASDAAPSQEMSVEELQAQVKDLGNQVAGLNDKLVKSFNRIADLEDDYSEAQERLASMSTKIKELEKERAEHLAALDTGLLVEKAHVSSEMQRMMDRVIEETAQRGQAESDKSKIEAELDELSSSLFSEANKMVAVERLSRARAEEKSVNMEERLKDTEGIMLEQQKVLTDLQRQVEKLQQGSAASKKSGDDSASIVSVESEAASFHRLKSSSLARSISQRTATQERRHKPTVDLAAEARLIINIVPYQEFRAFIAHLRKIRKQLTPFWSYPLTPHAGRESLNGTPTPRTASPAIQQPANSSATTAVASSYSQGLGGAIATSSPFAIAGVGRHRDHPTLPANVENLVSLPNQLSLPFIKRSQEEDIEPCLRLDFAPGLNWLSRRSVNTAILDGNLLIEPLFSGSQTIDEDQIRRENAHLPPAGCAMCGVSIVNVPLPGANAATASSTEAGARTSVVPSGIAGALGSFTGSSSGTNSGTVTPKPSRGGLFSSFRKSSTNVKAADGDAASAFPDTDASGSVASEAIVVAHLPVPTHIFRLGDSSSTRYLLCPQHCLWRLRAACQYWGFIRHLERTVVIEGKFANEEQQIVGGSMSSLDLPKEIAAVQPAKSAQVETLEKAVAAENGELTDSNDSEAVKPEEQAEEATAEKGENAETAEKGADGETQDDKTEAEKIKESVEEEVKTETTAEAESSNEKSDGQNDTPDTSSHDDHDGDKDHAGDHDDFADAESSPVTKDVDLQPDDTPAETEKAAETERPAETEPPTDAATDLKPSESTTGIIAPPLPPRSVARAANPIPPVIPPRRHLTPALPARKPTYTLAPPPPTAIYLHKLDSLEWEDRMWTEVTKLKEELWRARVGLVAEDAEASS